LSEIRELAFGHGYNLAYRMKQRIALLRIDGQRFDHFGLPVFQSCAVDFQPVAAAVLFDRNLHAALWAPNAPLRGRTVWVG